MTARHYPYAERDILRAIRKVETAGSRDTLRATASHAITLLNGELAHARQQLVRETQRSLERMKALHELQKQLTEAVQAHADFRRKE